MCIIDYKVNKNPDILWDYLIKNRCIPFKLLIFASVYGSRDGK